MDRTAALKVFESLGSGLRMDLFCLLVQAGERGKVAGEIADALEIPATNLSFHLKAMLQAGLVTVRQEGRFLRYRANVPHMLRVLAFVMENCALADAGARRLRERGCASRDRAGPEWRRLERLNRDLRLRVRCSAFLDHEHRGDHGHRERGAQRGRRRWREQLRPREVEEALRERGSGGREVPREPAADGSRGEDQSAERSHGGERRRDGSAHSTRLEKPSSGKRRRASSRRSRSMGSSGAWFVIESPFRVARAAGPFREGCAS